MTIITNDFQDVEKFCRQKRDSATTTTTMWSSEDVVDEASFVPTSPLAADNDSGIDRVSKHLLAFEKRAIGMIRKKESNYVVLCSMTGCRK